MDVTFPDNKNGCNELLPSDDVEGDDDIKNVKKWREVTKNIWHRVVESFHVKTQYGSGLIIVLQNRDGKNMKVWTTSIIGEAITTRMQLAINGKNLFIKSLAKRESMNGTNSYDFETILY